MGGLDLASATSGTGILDSSLYTGLEFGESQW